jgi:protein O-GlcNAc transferase
MRSMPDTVAPVNTPPRPPAADDAALLRALDDALRAARFADALALADGLRARHPEVAVVHLGAGLAALGLGRNEAAAEAFERTAALDPACTEAHRQLGVLRLAQGRLPEAEAALRRALEIDPAQPQVLNNLGIVLKNQHRTAEALECYARALALEPDDADLLGNQGVALMRLARYAPAEASLRAAAARAPARAAIWSNLGLAVMEQGRMEEAEALFRQALLLEPQRTDARSNLLFALNFTARHAPQAALAEARLYGEVVARTAKPYTAWNCDPQPARLRVGLVSGDLREHPVGFFLESLVAPLAAQGLELFAYPTHPRLDALGSRLKAGMAAWTPLLGLDDAAAAARIHADGVHVLLDLSGHTAHNRVPVFAWKPAPVQAAWLGYFATTGVAAIDALIADPVGVPPAQAWHFSERVVRLPHTRLCFTPPAGAPPVAALPAARRGHVTFGCFQNIAKIGPAVLAAWAGVLARVPGARLRLQNKALGDAAVAARLRASLAAAGIDTTRVDLHGAVPRAAYLAAHAEVDLLLDTFPFPGGTTTCEALWMGVPTVTLAGDRLLARQGAGLLHAAGLGDWVAGDLDGYVERAVAFAGDLDRLAAVRAGLRERVAGSPLFDATRFAAAMAAALRSLWRQYSGA